LLTDLARLILFTTVAFEGVQLRVLASRHRDRWVIGERVGRSVTVAGESRRVAPRRRCRHERGCV
jgi:hypothetical protein